MRIDNVHFLIFWRKSGLSSRSESIRPWRIWQRDTTGECVRRCSHFMPSLTRRAPGSGIALSRFGGRDASIVLAGGSSWRERDRSLESRQHSLRVLPKVRTPPTGTSIRSFSRYACVQAPELEARWHKTPIRRNGTDPYARHANLLLLPWPMRVASRISVPYKARCRDKPRSLSVSSSSHRRKSLTSILWTV